MLQKILEYSKNNKKKLIILALTLCFVFYLGFSALHHNLALPKTAFSYEKNESTVGGIWDITEVFQTFKPTKNALCGFRIRFGTFGRENNGNITVRLLSDPTDKSSVVFEEVFEAKILNDTSFKTFTFDPITNVKGKDYVIVVTADGVGDKPVTIWCTNNNAYKEGTLYVNGIESEADINMHILYCLEFGFQDFLIILVFLFLIVAILFMFKTDMFIFAKDAFLPKRVRIIALVFAYVFFLSCIGSYVKDSVIRYRLNVFPLVAFIVIIALTVIFEKWLGLYKSVFEYIKNEFTNLREKIKTIRNSSEKAPLIAELILRYVFILSTFAICVSVSIFLLLNHLSAKSIICVFTLAFLSTVSFIVKKAFFDKELKAPIFFLAASLLFGIFLCYSVPPGTDTSWDAEIHYQRVFDLKAMFFNESKTLFDERMEYKHTYDFVYFLKDTDAYMTKITSDYGVGYFDGVSSVNLYQYLGYLPFTVSIAVSKMLSMSVLPTIFLAKLTNLIIYTFVIYCGIKRLKSGAYLFSAVALIPCAIFLASHFGYDSWVTAFMLFAYACFISELQRPDEKISSRTVFLMLSAVFIGCGPKMVYFALAFPFIFLGKDKFTSKNAQRKYIIACIFTMLIIFISFALPFLVDVDANSDIRGGTDVDSGDQFSFIINNPLRYASILFNFILEYISLSNMSANITSFSYIGTPHPIYASIVIVLILFAAFTDKNEDTYPKRKRLAFITWLSCLAEIVLIATALYISFTPVAHPTVNGCQYRYLFPILVPVFYFFGSIKTKSSIKPNHMNAIIFGALSYAMFMSFYDVYVSVAISNL